MVARQRLSYLLLAEMKVLRGLVVRAFYCETEVCGFQSLDPVGCDVSSLSSTVYLAKHLVRAVSSIPSPKLMNLMIVYNNVINIPLVEGLANKEPVECTTILHLLWGSTGSDQVILP